MHKCIKQPLIFEIFSFKKEIVEDKTKKPMENYNTNLPFCFVQ